MGALALPGGRFLSWGEDETLRLWNSDATPFGNPLSHAGVNGALAFADGGFLSWSTGPAGSLRLWKPDGTPYAELTGHKGPVNGALILDDGRIISWSEDKSLRLWRSDGTSEGDPIHGHKGSVTGVLELPDRRIVSWSEDELRLWRSDGSPLGNPLRGHRGSVTGALGLPDGRIVSWSDDSALRLWRCDGTLDDVLLGHRDRINGSLIDSKQRIVSWSNDSTLRLWRSDSAANCETPYKIRSSALTPANSYESAVFLQGGRILSWTFDTIQLWHSDCTPDGEPRPAGLNIRYELELPDGRFLLSHSHGLQFWHRNGTPAGESMRAWRGTIPLTDGRLLLWGYGGEFQLWNSDGTPASQLPSGHKDVVAGAIALADGGVLLWSPAGVLQRRRSDGTPEGEPLRDIPYENNRLAKPTFFGPVKAPALSDGWGLEALALPDGGFLLWGAKGFRRWRPDGTVETHAHSYQKPFARINGALVLSDQRILWWNSWGGDLQLTDFDGKPCGDAMHRDKHFVRGAAVTLESNIASFDLENVCLWTIQGRLLRTISFDARILYCDGKTVITARAGGLAVYDLHPV